MAVSAKKQNNAKPSFCLCKAFRPALIVCRIYGFFPVVATHENGICRFKVSVPWFIFSCVTITFLAIQLIIGTEILDIFNISNGKPIHSILRSVNSIIYSIYVTVLTMLNVAQATNYVKALNKLLPILKEGLLCQSALKVIFVIQCGFIVTVTGAMFMQYSALVYLHFSESYETNFDYKVFTSQVTQDITFVFYVIFLGICSIFIGVCACFEKLVISALDFKPVHPMKGIDETNNHRSFMGIFTYKLCKDSHLCTPALKQLKRHEVVEYLRCLHEDFSIVMYEVNNSMNPQFLCHMIVELTVLIVNYYSVVLYFAYEFKTPVSSTMHFLNCLFVLLHTIGIYLFLKNAQQLQNMIRGLINFLLEFSTRISTPEEHQQVRIFIEKLKLHRPISASGVVNIDLSIAGPICANILTYVLVALQFDVPKT